MIAEPVTATAQSSRAAKPMTAEELLSLPSGMGQRYELIEGELKTMTPAGGEHGAIHMELGSHLHQHVKQRGLGTVFGAETGFRIGRDPDTVRAPDVAFLRRERWESLEHPEKYIEGAPDLAVEVVSPGDAHDEVHEKALAWLGAGARLVWVVQPRSRTVTIYHPDRSARVLSAAAGEALDGEDVVPGFRLAVAALFE